MAEKDPYIEKAYEELERMSADEKKRLEYEAREKALRDYNSQMSSARRRGEAIGKEIGEKIGIKLGEKVVKRELSLICISWENQLKKFQFLQDAVKK